MASKIQDTYFFDAEAAYETALQNNTVEVTPGWHLKQVCYYHGEPITNPPENLINVLLDDIVDFFSTTRLRRPTQVVAPRVASENVAVEFSTTFQTLMNESESRRLLQIERLMRELHQKDRVHTYGSFYIADINV